MSVYLRVKPKTPEETEFYTCSDEVDMANLEDENFEVVTIESTHQVRLDNHFTRCLGLEATLFKVTLKCLGCHKQF